MNQTLTQIEEEFENMLVIRARFNPKEPIYGEENRRDLIQLKSFLTQSNQRVLEKVRQVVKSELIKRMMKYDSKDGYSTLHDEILEKVSNDVDDILSTLIEQK